MNVKFTATKKESEIIRAIADRGVNFCADSGVEIKKIDAIMDIEATHCNGRKLDLERFLAADDFNFAHDFFGIYRHLDRNTGKLGGHFVPRFSA